MPYIKQETREKHYPIRPAVSVGELNYRICREVNEYLKGQYAECYRSYNDVIGVLECAKLEIYRRLVVGYEERALAENGDVFARQEWEAKL